MATLARGLASNIEDKLFNIGGRILVMCADIGMKFKQSTILGYYKEKWALFFSSSNETKQILN